MVPTAQRRGKLKVQEVLLPGVEDLGREDGDLLVGRVLQHGQDAVRQVGLALVQDGGLRDVQALAVQDHPVGVVLHVNLDLGRAGEAQRGEVGVDEQMVVHWHDVVWEPDLAPREGEAVGGRAGAFICPSRGVGGLACAKCHQGQ